jgi:hypothetical protein
MRLVALLLLLRDYCCSSLIPFLQALVDRSLGCLHPLAVTSFNFGFGSVPCLVYQSLFQSSSIKQHLLDAGPVHAGFYLMSRQFTNLHTLSVDCQSKGCVDYEHLALLSALRRLRLCQFSFTHEAFAAGLARCSGLQVLHLEGQQVGCCSQLFGNLVRSSCTQCCAAVGVLTVHVRGLASKQQQARPCHPGVLWAIAELHAEYCCFFCVVLCSHAAGAQLA